LITSGSIRADGWNSRSATHRQLIEGKGHPLVCKHLDDKFPAWQGKLIVEAFALKKGIAAAQFTYFFCVFFFRC
ncbi:hypothetical protein, partial [Zoogloea sp.]|uniref:hypothetical protein n=1 Tax=Zoogloea sp. TaxID=49181 RepID=UPI00262176C8